MSMATSPTETRPDITKCLARFILRTRWEDIPQRVRHEAKRALLNFFGAAISGCREPAIDLAAASLSEFSGGAQATIIGRQKRIDVLSASFLNAASAHVGDFDDTHIPTVIHPTAPVAPALLALAEHRPMTGEDLLTAFVLGVEVECRIGKAIMAAHSRRGWHITATCGILGAASAAGKALRHDETKTIYGLGNAATQASGLIECCDTMAKSIGIGNASRNGLWSALLAERGFTAPPRSIEGEHGFLAVMASAVDVKAVTAGLGESWELMRNSYKPYPCGVAVSPVIDCCLMLRGALASVDDLAQVVIVGNPRLMARADRRDPAPGREARSSAQHAAAVSLLFGAPGSAAFSDVRVQDPNVCALRGRIILQADPALGIEAARVTLRMVDGREHTIGMEQARGGLERPLTDTELELKFESLVTPQMSRQTQRRLIDSIWMLERSVDVADVLLLTSPDH